MNTKHNTLIQEILDAESRQDQARIGRLLMDSRIVDIDLYNAKNYIPDPSAIDDLMDPYDLLALENDMIKKEMAVVEQVIDELIDSKEERINTINERWAAPRQ